MANSTKAHRVLLLTHARTASHLLERMLSAQPGVHYGSHFFADAWPLRLQLLDAGPLTQAPPELCKELHQAWQNMYAVWSAFFTDAAVQGKTAFFHGHPHFMFKPSIGSRYVYGTGESEPADAARNFEVGNGTHTNPTILPDEELLTPGTQPVFTIRHPALMIPSIVRTLNAVSPAPVSREVMLYCSTLRWQRLLFDWFEEKGEATGIRPIIVDADDYMGPHKAKFMANLCKTIGLKEENVIYQWPKATETELKAIPGFIAEIKKTILGSEGLIEGNDARGLDMQKEQEKWRKAFSKKDVGLIIELVELTIYDYEYLKARKLVVAPED